MKKLLLLSSLFTISLGIAQQDISVNCAVGEQNLIYCYGNNDNSTFSFVSDTGDPIFLVFNSGTIESGFDEITVYDSADNSGAVLFTGDNGGDLAGLSFQSSGDGLFIEVSSDGSVSCQSGSRTEWDITYRCVTCISPEAAYNIVSNCSNGNEEFFIDVVIIDTGDADSINILDDQGSPVQNVTATGTYNFGPFANGTQVNITVEDADDINCILDSGALGQDFCPAQECDIINAGPDTIFGCDDDVASVDLSATFMTSALTTNTSVYNITDLECPVSNLNGTPTALNIDDRWSSPIDLGFEFEFFGITYNQVVAGANGLIGFDTSLAGEFCPWSFEPDELIPTPDLPTNAIFGAYHDIDPSVGGTIEFTTVGVAPERQFKLSFVNVPHFSCNELLTTQQIILYESSNVIDVIVLEKPVCATWNDGLATIGVQNSDGSVGYSPGGRNTGDWVVSFQELWRFIPDGAPNYVFEWFDEDGNSLGNDPNITVSPTETSTYTASITYTDANGNESVVTDEVTVTVINDVPTPGTVEDLVECEVTPETASFDLTSQNDAIFNGESGLEVTYYETQQDADNDENPIINDNNYENTSNPQTIYFRVFYTLSPNCFTIGNFEISTIEAPQPGSADNMENCSDENGDTFYDLTLQDSVIIDGQSNVNVSYFESQTDANNNTNPIVNSDNYLSLQNPQTIYFRIQLGSNDVCFETGSFDLISTQLPIPGLAGDLVNCANANGNAIFDLTSQNSIILNGQTSVEVAYYESLFDAENDQNPILSPDSYQNAVNPQTIYFRLYSTVNPDCFSVGNFNLIVTFLDVNLIGVDQGCEGDEYTISISPVDNSYDPNTVTYEWFGPPGASTANNTSATFVATADGTYTVEITTVDGCVYAKDVDVLNAACVFPQGISPNMDGLNDTFDLRAFNIEEIEIFNRNGRSVYRKTNYTNEWIGQSDNGDLPVGTYYYVARLDNDTMRTGWVYIQR